MKTIEDWRQFAEFYLCPNCIQKYKVYFEPNISHLLLNPIDDWREVESNITRMVMITEGVSKGNIEILSFTEDPYFIWDEENEWRLIKFLKNNYSIDWIKTAKIKRSRNTIKLFTEKNNLSLSLNTEKAKVSLKINDVKTYELIVKTERKCLFSWDEIPGNDNIRLIEFLKKNFGIDSVKTTKIEKTDYGKTIQVSTGKNFSLTLNDKKTKLIIKIENGRTDEFIAKTENGKLNIYEKNTRKMIYKEDKEGSNELLGEEFKWEDFRKIKLDWSFTDKINTLHKKGIIRDCSYRVLKEANEVRNKIHDPPIGKLFSEQDLKLFSDAHAITDKLLMATNGGFGETYSTNLKSEVEKFAKECLLKLN